MPVKVGMVSLGCNKNQVDAERMLFKIKEAGYQLVADAAEAVSEQEKLQRFSAVFSFTDREAEVFACLVGTEDSIQEIADRLYISRRTLERNISAIYEKTGVRSRIGLLNLYNK